MSRNLNELVKNLHHRQIAIQDGVEIRKDELFVALRIKLNYYGHYERLLDVVPTLIRDG
jgi:hypothetical protein